MLRRLNIIVLSSVLLVSLITVTPKSTFAATGACLMDKTGLSEFTGLSSVDLLARLIFAEAGGETITGKKGVAFVAKNRKDKNIAEFGTGGTYASVILKPGEFEGMTKVYARCPDTSLSIWKDSLYVANNMPNLSNPIGKSLWFNRNDVYHARQNKYTSYEDYTFNGGATYKRVVEKYIIGQHTFFRIEGY